MTQPGIAVRLDLVGDERVREDLRKVGATGTEAFTEIRRSATGATREVGAFGRSARGLGTGLGGSTFAIQNAAFQISDFAVQVGAGTSATRAFAQQAPQLLGALGPLGAVLGAGVAGLGAYILSSSKAEEETGDLAAAVRDYRAAAEEAMKPTGDLVERYGAAADAARELLRAQTLLLEIDVNARLRASAASLSEIYGDVAGRTRAEFEVAGRVIDSLQSRLAELRAGAAATSVDEGQRIQAEINSFGQLSDVIRQVQIELDVSAKEAGRLAGAFAELQAADTTADRVRIMQELAQTLTQAAANTDDLSAETSQVVREIVEAALAGTDLAATLDRAEIAASGTAAATSSIDMSGAVDQAGQLAERLGLSLQTAVRIAALGPQGVVPSAPQGGRGGDPREQGGSFFDWQTREAIQFLENWTAPSVSEGRGGSGGRSSPVQEIEEIATGWALVSENLGKYSDEAMDYGAQIAGAMTGAFSAAEDAVARFVTTGKADIGDLVRSIISDISRIATRTLVTGPLSDALSGLFGGGSAGVAHTGAMVGSSMAMRNVSPLAFLGAPRMHSGGMLGLAPDERPIIAQTGERILNRAETRAYNRGGGALRIVIEEAPGFAARVRAEAQGVAVEMVQAGLSEYDRRVAPVTQRRISGDPRRRG